MTETAKTYIKAKRMLFFNSILLQIARSSRLKQMDMYPQHGNTSCLLHSVAVAYMSYRMALFCTAFHIHFHQRDLIRGALLHDYFLYDWHTHAVGTSWHGFKHPERAYQNASGIFTLSSIEKDIIKKHMFPLTPKPPASREALVVCLADKICAIYELFAKKPYRGRHIQRAMSLCTAKGQKGDF